MARSLKKGPYVDEKLLKKIKNLKSGEKEIIKSSDTAKTYTETRIGYILRDLGFTRKRYCHNGLS